MRTVSECLNFAREYCKDSILVWLEHTQGQCLSVTREYGEGSVLVWPDNTMTMS